MSQPSPFLINSFSSFCLSGVQPGGGGGVVRVFGPPNILKGPKCKILYSKNVSYSSNKADLEKKLRWPTSVTAKY